MARATPVVREGVLTFPPERDHAPIPVESPAWWTWVAAPDAPSFRFEREALRFTARRERKPGGAYWYAYRQQRGRLHKVYLGRATDLTLSRLQAGAAALAALTDAADGPIGTLPRPPQTQPALPSVTCSRPNSTCRVFAAPW